MYLDKRNIIILIYKYYYNNNGKAAKKYNFNNKITFFEYICNEIIIK